MTAPTAPPLPATIDRAHHLSLLLALTQIPTASGREDRVVRFVRSWLDQRPELSVTTDPAGNMDIRLRAAGGTRNEAESGPPLYITGHLDHPAFVVERVIASGTVELSFRGGVMDVFFENAPLEIVARDDARLPATITATSPAAGPFKHYIAELDEVREKAGSAAVAVGDIAVWALPPAEIIDGNVHTNACDDLAAVAAAMAAMDVLISQTRAGSPPHQDVRLLFTRAEEVGFIGAIAACRNGTMPKESRVIALENSRAFPESPIDGGPIVRVGDRLSVFTPWLTSACAKRAEETFARPSSVVASQNASQATGAASRPWQRKLMAGGACEASVFCAAGYAATCLCLPLGNYHNMPHLSELQAGTYDRERLGPPRAAREFIGVEDYLGLIDLLVSISHQLPGPDVLAGGAAFIDKLWRERSFVLER